MELFNTAPSFCANCLAGDCAQCGAKNRTLADAATSAYATHLRCCRVCGSEAIYACPEGGRLLMAALEARAGSQISTVVASAHGLAATASR